MTTPSTRLGAATPGVGAAPAGRAILAQTRAELTMTLRRGETLLVTLIVPVVLFFFFAWILSRLPNGGNVISFLLPGIITVAIMSTAMVSLGIATAYDRYYGVLKRLGASPLPRWGLLVAKLLSVLAIEVVQVVLLVILAVLVYGWRPAGPEWAALPILLLGTAAFAGLGMLMAGALRAEATLGITNGLYVIFLAIGGIFLPVDHLPPVLQWLAAALPPAALSDALRGALTSQGVHAGSVALLAAWAIIFVVAAALTFKWE